MGEKEKERETVKEKEEERERVRERERERERENKKKLGMICSMGNGCCCVPVVPSVLSAAGQSCSRTSVQQLTLIRSLMPRSSS